MYERSAVVYDAIYESIGKDYEQESRRVLAVLTEHSRIPIDSLLDVACGTGGHLVHLKDLCAVEGLELNEAMLAVAREKLPGLSIHMGDMHDFDLGRTFDAVICLFSAIGYADGVAGLQRCMTAFYRHTNPGGVVLVEPWLLPEVYTGGSLHATTVDQPDLKITRMNISGLEGRKSVMDMHHLVGTPEGIDYFVERHELTLFTHEEYLAAMRAAGFEAVYDEEGLIGRGLYIGRKPPFA